ncbi:hypothetical protein [Pseudoxanthomonas koreensis]|uniref:hypothetical protein n=1 Tax=Pseudoxanthomonas koreensis TaxID=266061 RepID=UPI001EE4C8CA|nr:hypothetical protein CSC64_06765 [Pseudoxanthomonas koreensis]
MCAPNTGVQQRQQIQLQTVPQVSPLAGYEYVRAQGEAGARRAREEQEHRARMELLQAQTQAAQAPVYMGSPEPAPAGKRVLYSCRTSEGKENITEQPFVGCMVYSVSD